MDDNNFEEFFDLAEQLFAPVVVGELAEIMKTSGISPIPYLSHIPECFYSNDDSVKDYKTPSHIKTIGYKAFFLSDIEKLRVTSNVRVLFEDCFAGCDSLKHVVIEEGVHTIRDSAFYGADQLSYIHLPYSLKYLGACVFYGCSKLLSIYYNGTVNNWEMIDKSGKLVETDSNSVQIVCTDGTINLCER